MLYGSLNAFWRLLQAENHLRSDRSNYVPVTLAGRAKRSNVSSPAQAGEPNLWNWRVNGRTASFKHFEPCLYFLAERCDFHAFKERR